MTRTDIQNAIVGLLEDDSYFKGFTIKKTVQALYPMDFDVLSGVGALLVSISGSNSDNALFKTTLGKVTKIKVAIGVRSVLDSPIKLDEAIDQVYSCLGFCKISQECADLVPVQDRALTERPADGIFWSEIEFKLLHYYNRDRDY